MRISPASQSQSDAAKLRSTTAVTAGLNAPSVRSERLEHKDDFDGTATEILEMLSAGRDEKVIKHADWPKSAPALGTKLREVAPNIRRLGIEIRFERNGAERRIRIRRAAKPPEMRSLLSSPSPAPPNPVADTKTEGAELLRCDSDLSVGDSDPAPSDSDTSGLQALKTGE